jgi:predicted flap endonuclease-1-like 5' DNA nuclease
MTYLLLQTFLLLLASYFLGAFLACTAKRAIMGSRQPAPVHIGAPLTVDTPLHPPVGAAAPRPVLHRPTAPPVVPRPIDPVQPRIDVIRRPEPRPVPKLIDPSRFERALMGPDPNEGIPRKAIPEIRPTVLKPVTGAYQPGSYGPPPEPEPEIPPPPAQPIVIESEPEPFEPEPFEREPLMTDVESEPAPEQVVTPREKPARLTTRLSGVTTFAAAAAVAAAKAAAAASVSSIARRRPAPELQKEEKPAPPVSVVEEPAEEPEEIAYEKIEDRVDEIHEEAVHADDEGTDAEEPPHTEEPASAVPVIALEPVVRQPIEGGDDFQRIRAIDADIEQRLKAEGIDSFEHIAAWSLADVKRFSQLLDIPGRIDREQWVEQAQILAKGGETYYSRNRVAAQKAATSVEKPTGSQVAELVAAQVSGSDAAEDKPQPEPVAPSAKEEANAEKVAALPVVDTRSGAQLSGVAAAIQGRSVAEMAAAAAAAIAAASASVTRGLKPIEPISPLSKVDPKISMPAKLSDAIKEKEAAAAQPPAEVEAQPPRPMAASSQGPNDDLKRIRGVGVLIEKRLNAMGISRYEQIANWTSGEIDRVSQVLEFKGRIEREGWVEQARILLNGGQTEFSRRVDRGEVDTSRET